MTITETQKQNAIDAINELCESQLEYETSHRDAGDSYADLVSGLWYKQKTCDLIQSLSEEADLANYKPLEIDERWKDIKPDVLAGIALETFNMVPGSIWGPYGDDCIVLESFHIGEVEVSLDHPRD